jgi:hypothetical protein
VTVWIDPNTELPVQIQSDETFVNPEGARIETTLYRNIQWNPILESRFFSTIPPAGFREVPPRYAVPYDPGAPPPSQDESKI